MFEAVTENNVGLMDDILKRYSGELDDIVDDYGNSLPALAAIQGDYQMIQLLLDRGFDPNLQNEDGDTPLHKAIVNGAVFCTDILMNYGVDESIVNFRGFLAWELSGDLAMKKKICQIGE